MIFNWGCIFHSLVLTVSFVFSFILARRNRSFWAFLFSLGIGLLLFELAIALMLYFPLFARLGPRGFLRNIYMSGYRNIIQLEPEFARYDPYLKYTLKPGVFLFRNPEFANEFRVNSLGVRDDEFSSESPEIVVVGDSLPMGWGVGQDQTFAQVLEQSSGLKVLNAAVSSYSTVEALRIIDRIDISKAKYLIIAYGHGKYFENLGYYKAQDKFKVLSRKEYEQASDSYHKLKEYLPMKYTSLAFLELRNRLFHISPPVISIPMETEAKVFLNAVVKASHKDLSGIKIIVLCEKDFVEPLKRAVAAFKTPGHFIRGVTIIGQPEIIGDRAYILDDHPTAEWHKAVAVEIAGILRENG